MSGMGEKIKEKLHLGHHHKEEVKVKADEAGIKEKVKVKAYEGGVKEEVKVKTHAPGHTGKGEDARTYVQTPPISSLAPGGGVPAEGERRGAAVCGAQTFTTVEDRAVEKDVIEHIVEHRPVEKKFVVETRPAGEEMLHDQRRVESVGVREEITKVAPKSSPCEGGPELEVRK